VEGPGHSLPQAGSYGWYQCTPSGMALLTWHNGEFSIPLTPKTLLSRHVPRSSNHVLQTGPV
jgi:hypothetical protein